MKYTEADKNIGLVLIDKKIYDNLCYNHLNDLFTYEQINNFNTFDLQTQSLNLISTLHDKNRINTRLWSFLHNIIKIKEKIGRFRILPKFHKEKFGNRPVINCNNTTIEILSKFIDFILQPIVKKQAFYIIDFQNLIQLTQES